MKAGKSGEFAIIPGDAYEKVVDRLLAAPRYGEHMAVDWLDAARYADTKGYQVDRDREIWRWRDWVVIGNVGARDVSIK